MSRWHQFILALVFLTRLPLGRLLPARVMPLANSAWAFPLAGAVIGALAGLPLLLPGPPFLLAALSVTLSVWFTGALHEDGLADFADAAGGRDRDDRLRIMRDSHVGSYGVMALALSTAIRIAALAHLGPWQLIAAAAAGRTASVLTMGALWPARQDGLGRAAELPGWRNVCLATLIAILLLLPAGEGRLLALIAGAFALSLTIRQARLWLNGQTGDVLGTASVVTETSILAAFALTA